MNTQSSIVLDKNGISINGKREILLCASLFYFRIPAELWRDRVRKLRLSGYNCADVYFPWNYHANAPGDWNFEADRDVEAFLSILAEEGIYVVARPGPYICSEWDGGSIPGWLLADGTEIRSDHPRWMAEVREWYARIVPMLAKHQIHRGGSIILLQVENELDFFDCPDPNAYMGKLAALCREFGIEVPVFGCAGQGCAERATGWAEDIVPTFNFYPSAFDSSFDPVCLTVHRELQERNLPFLITETGREHFLLRREMANGARLLGAYNQVGGTNFGFTTSINNWGKGESPLSFLATDYDFASMIDPMGRFRAEALEGRLLGGLLEAVGEPLAMSLIRDDHEAVIKWAEPDEKNRGNGNLLDMGAVGTLLSVPNFTDREQRVTVTAPEGCFHAVIGPYRAPFFPLSLSLAQTGCDGMLLYASAEVLKLAQGELFLYADGAPEAVFKAGNGEQVRIEGFGGHRLVLDGKALQVTMLRREEAQRMDIGRGPLEGPVPAVLGSKGLSAASVRKAEPESEWMVPHSGRDGIGMEACGIFRGTLSYQISAAPETGILMKNAADIIQGWRNGEFLGSRVSGGQWQHYAAGESLDGGPLSWRFRVESWGHSNFDDARLPSMRIAAPKGIAGIYQVDGTDGDALMWRFRMEETWLPDSLKVCQEPMAAILPPNAWNSTRMPLISSYSTQWTLRTGSDACALEMDGAVAETAVYVDGMLAGVMNAFDPWLELTGWLEPGKPGLISLLCRKRHWAEPAGSPKLHHLTKLNPVMTGCSEQRLALHDFGGSVSNDVMGKRKSIPLEGFSLVPGETRVFHFDLDGMTQLCANLRIRGLDMKATGLFNGHLLGRVFSPGGCRPEMVGGDAELLYLPGPWFVEKGNRLVLIVEALGPDAILESVSLES